MSPVAWSLALVCWFVLTGAVVTTGAVLPYSGLALAVLLLLILAGLLGWRRLTSGSELPVVLLAPFAPVTPGASEASLLHVEAMRARLVEGPLGEHLELRRVPAPISRRDAGRLLDMTSATAVVFGRVKSIGTEATWEAELLARWPGDEPADAHIEQGPEGLVIEPYDRRVELPPRHELVIEPRAPVGRLIEERFQSDHVDRVEGTLLALSAAELSEFHEEAARSCFEAAQILRAKLSARTRASLEITRAGLEEFANGRDMLAALESAGRRDANHVDLWNFLAAIGYLGMRAGDITQDDFLRYAQHAVAADPEDALARYNLGEALMAVGRPEEALAEFDRIANDPDYAERYYLHLARGIITYNIGRFAEARDAYARAVALEPTAKAHLYLGDAYRALGQRDSARRHYVAALRLHPELVDAHRGYWYEGDGQDLVAAASSFDRSYRILMAIPGFGWRRWRRPLVRYLLRRHYRRHPEDSRIHYMLGAHALIGGDLDTAEERLKFALQLLDRDYEALARLAVVYALQQRKEEAAAAIDQLWDTPGPQGRAPDDRQRRGIAASFVAPFLEEPRLASNSDGEWILEQLFARFGSVTGEAHVFVAEVAGGRVPLLSGM